MEKWKEEMINSLRRKVLSRFGIRNVRTKKAPWMDGDEIGEIKNIMHNAENLVKHLCFKPGGVSCETLDTIYFRFTFYDKGGDRLTVDVGENEYRVGTRLDGYCLMPTIIKPQQLYIVLNWVKLFYRHTPSFAVLFSGAFNPPTIAHRYVMEQALDDIYDFVIVAACNENFLDKKTNRAWKSGKTGSWYFSEQARIDMLVEMTCSNERILIYGIEDGYTYEVLHNAQAMFGAANMNFAMGSDKIRELHKWGYSEKLLKEFGFMITNRTDDANYIHEECKKAGIPMSRYSVVFNDNPLYADVSATEVRKRVDEGDSGYRLMVTEEVAEYLFPLVE